MRPIKQSIFLIINNRGVQRMTKTLPGLARGEHVVKVDIEIKPEAFRDPILTKEIVISDWRRGIDISDVDFKLPYISEQEAEKIRADRLEKTIASLKEQGYTIQKPEGTDESTE